MGRKPLVGFVQYFSHKFDDKFLCVLFLQKKNTLIMLSQLSLRVQQEEEEESLSPFYQKEGKFTKPKWSH